MRNMILIFTSLCVMFFAIVFGANYAVTLSSLDGSYNTIEEVPYTHVGLLLGTSKYATGGGLNQYFASRIQAAKELLIADRIDYLVISGDNGTANYNEPESMKQALIAEGIPEDRLILDYAGFDTYDSVVRMQKVFQQQEFIIVSQEFHTARALFIAKHKGLNAIAYNAKEIQGPSSGPLWVRETFARVKAVLDVISDRDPKFLGDPITIPQQRYTQPQ